MQRALEGCQPLILRSLCDDATGDTCQVGSMPALNCNELLGGLLCDASNQFQRALRQLTLLCLHRLAVDQPPWWLYTVMSAPLQPSPCTGDGCLLAGHVQPLCTRKGGPLHFDV